MSNTTASAPELTREQVASILTQPLSAASTFLSSGPTIFDTTGPLRVPAAPTFDLDDVDWTGESEQIPEVDADTGELQLLPSTMKSVKVITRYSNELARQSVMALDAALKSRLVSEVAAKLDGQFYSASGDGVTIPRGMFAWQGVQTIAVSGELTLDAILDAEALALGANVDRSRLRLFVRPGDFMHLRQIKDGDSRFMLQPDATQGTVSSILGLPVVVSPRIPVGHAALADMSQVAVARDLDPSVKILTERYADYDEQAIRVVARYDVKPLNPSAVVTLTGITAP